MPHLDAVDGTQDGPLQGPEGIAILLTWIPLKEEVRTHAWMLYTAGDHHALCH